jgi:Ca2+-binding RTX toxin-like protein
VNGDGLADFIIGAYANANSNGNAYVVYGKSGSSYAGLSLTNGAIATTDGFQIVGGLTAGLGVSVSGAGDVNGDGLSDVIVSGTDSTAYVVYGNATGTTVNAAPGALASSNSIGFRIGTLQNTSDFARIVSSAGDVNGDGLADVIVGSHYSNSAYVIYGNATGSPVSIDAAGGIPSSLGFQILSAKVMDFGNWVSSAGDVNGDGLADVIIGTNTDSVGAYVVYGNASGTFVSVNANGDIAASNGFRITGPASGIYGYRVSGAGDINGDGLADLLVGSNATGYSLVLGGTQWETAAVVGNGTVTGTASAEAVIGSEAADALTGGGGADRFYAGLGNDTIVLTASDVTNLANNTAGGPKALVNGGGGFDTIRMSGGAALDLTSIRNAGAMSLEENSRIESIERIDLATDTAANTLTLTAQDVKDMAGVNLIHTGTASADGNVWTNVTGTALSTSTGYHQMVVDGSALDTLNLMSVTGTWANAGTVSNGTCNYTVYQSAAVDTQVIVNAAVVVPMTLLGTQGADSLTGGAGADLIMGGTGYVRDGQFEYWPTYATGGNLSQGWATMTPTGGWTWASNAEVGVWASPATLQSVLNTLTGYKDAGGRFNMDLDSTGLATSVNVQPNGTYTLSWVMTDGSMAVSATKSASLFLNGQQVFTESSTVDASGNTSAHTETVAAAYTGVVTVSSVDLGDASGTLSGSTGGTNATSGELRKYTVTFNASSFAAPDGTLPIKWTSTASVSDGLRFDDVKLINATADGNDAINGGAGDDRIFGMEGNDTIYGGAGADVFFYSTRLNNGTDVIKDFVVGTDKIIVGDMVNLTVSNSTTETMVSASTSDTYITAADAILSTGNGIDQRMSWNDTTKTLTFNWGGSVQIEGLATSYADVAALVTAGVVKLTSNSFSSTIAPVVLDLNRDGTLGYSQVTMDVNGDGHLDTTAWAAAQDGVLVWDKFADGLVHDNSQYAFAQYATSFVNGKPATDLQGLADAFDTNHDGLFDAQDAKFAEFKVWQDLNQNGVSDAGEVRSLADGGITSINLVSDGVVRTPASGVTEAGHTTATTADGSSLVVADAAFAYSSVNYSLSIAPVDSNTPAVTLNLLGGNMNLDLSSFVAQHGHIDAVDLSGTGANTLKLNLSDVLQGRLQVSGDADDSVVLNASEWTDSGTTLLQNGHHYEVYNANQHVNAQLLIEQHMGVQNV